MPPPIAVSAASQAAAILSTGCYVLVGIVRKRLGLEASLYTFLPIILVAVFEKIAIQSALLAAPYRSGEATDNNQLNLLSN